MASASSHNWAWRSAVRWRNNASIVAVVVAIVVVAAHSSSCSCSGDKGLEVAVSVATPPWAALLLVMAPTSWCDPQVLVGWSGRRASTEALKWVWPEVRMRFSRLNERKF